MTNLDLYNVKTGIEKCKDIVNVANINFAISMARIYSEVLAELKILEHGIKPFSAEYKEYIKESDEITSKYAIVKEDGTYQILNDKIIVRKPLDYNKELNELNIKYKDAIQVVKDNAEEWEKILNTQTTVKISKLPKSCIPSQLTVEQITLLFPVIE
ncbi:MAG: hypothetical protein M0R17_06920 [Candidatus Omnitrophica bacterium]|jgi:hypothetical protein|nr:hypothetical protein [Candidatus Omnitrophota bacterium]